MISADAERAAAEARGALDQLAAGDVGVVDRRRRAGRRPSCGRPRRTRRRGAPGPRPRRGRTSCVNCTARCRRRGSTDRRSGRSAGCTGVQARSSGRPAPAYSPRPEQVDARNASAETPASTNHSATASLGALLGAGARRRATGRVAVATSTSSSFVPERRPSSSRVIAFEFSAVCLFGDRRAVAGRS